MNDVKTLKILRDNAFCHAAWMDFKTILSESPFGVFLEFVDPRNGKLVQQLFPFWCKPQKTYKPMGNVFMTQWQGLTLTIPSDVDWWIKAQSNGIGMRRIDQRVQFLKHGEYVEVNLRVEMATIIRINPEFSPEFDAATHA
ncbi:hypothetical protein EX227_13025 [Providencia rettgeri]|uniref:Uncharacterized protein n=1 Tax=Providencia rettgeri TaxID=587 RepID=A0AAP2JW99_PRORE|nr:hypothetical protein [Providencia rettgeri]ELI9034890.1 hypothetical protein [Morganella morganii]MBX6949509.1 hypothetical protein [Providencia rettgeri]MBX6956399.1 hypothetical protein [Providencia rettgeri]MBX6958261.1 hypothetical protein [Providencia rettgeri]MBX6971264.1 hypothetical protein [Providencia rettgeri]